MKLAIINRKARFDYEFLETYVAGICLFGSEVKSIRDSRVSMIDAFCFFINGELWLKGLNVTPGLNSFQHDPVRDRKLLLKRRELKKIESKLDSGLTIIPVKLFASDRNIIKVEIALARGKKSYDKRNAIKERDIKREMKNEF